MAKVISYAKACCSIVTLWLSLCPQFVSAQGKDIQWLRSIYHHRNNSLEGTMKILSDSHMPVNGAVPLAQLIYGYATHEKKTIQYGWQTAGSAVLTILVTQGMKYAIDRPRPYTTYTDIIPYKYNTDGSMPSGHTSSCFSTATSLSLEYPKWYVIAPSYLYACAVSYSRLYLGEHYPSDVFVGALVGAGSSYLSYQGQKWLQNRKAHKKLKVPAEK